MSILTTLITAVVSLSSFTTSTPTQFRRQITTSITPDFCTNASYPYGDPPPYGEPYGSGYCAGLTADLGLCYTWSDFGSVADPLVNNLTYAFIPGTYECDLYKDTTCQGEYYDAQDGDNDLSNLEFGPTDFNDAVNSFICKES